MRNFILIIFGIIILAIQIIFAARLLMPEDSWICKDGAWMRHGNPSAAMPNKPYK